MAPVSFSKAFSRSPMSQNRGFTQGFVAIERFSILMIYSKKKSGPKDCVIIGRLHCINNSPTDHSPFFYGIKLE